jgi:ribosomal protein L7/L12
MNARSITITQEIKVAIQKAVANGESAEQLSKRMADLGLEKTAAIKLLRETAKMDLAAAKELIHFSPAWAFRRKADEAFHESLYEGLEELNALDTNETEQIAS